ncbi:queuosine precursor transporter [Chromatium okenii]|uniref:queuosine precursor transporter n=1 Tax=Chromatium okenii TaxID=61644 RepID=UPI0026F2A8FD|nr:queuosine precursor transporter [Chromatium okenii]
MNTTVSRLGTFDRPTRLFIVLGGFFVCNALIAEFIGVKIFALERTIGLNPFNWTLFQQSGSLSFTAGVLLWPIVFVMTDIINEYYGQRGVRFLSYLTACLIIYAFAFAYLAILLVPAPWWISIQSENGVPDMQAAFQAIFGQGMWIIAGSLIAFLVGQIIDVTLFQLIRRITGQRYLWLRATGSTLVSQFIDSFVVLYIAFVLGPQHWSTDLFLAVGTVNYFYKGMVAILLTPVIYLVHKWIDHYLDSHVAK